MQTTYSLLCRVQTNDCLSRRFQNFNFPHFATEAKDFSKMSFSDILGQSQYGNRHEVQQILFAEIGRGVSFENG